ncbi:ATP-binding protein [Candidatus Electrothrix sp.]|uniref:ATP-binding protein n=1 Tax=Candidatus Electrothrix sp. TaxID=2170559 RepID=UPI004057B7F7
MNSDSVIIGKNIIEILTTGMYHNPLVIFREYVQNSIDAINEAVTREILEDISEGDIQIVIDKEKRRISFEDNGVGIPRENAWQVLTSIAASSKDRTKNLGFRGIGRLAGLAYCDELIIETSFKGEDTKTVLQWNGQKLKEIISDKKDKKLASEVIQAITTIEDGIVEHKDKHYFNVILQNVKNVKLLDDDAVTKNLRMVAPVDFYDPKFVFTSKVKKGLVDRGVSCEGYRIFVNTTQLFKAYRNNVYKQEKKQKKRIDEVIDIEFFDLYSKHNQLLAVGWYAVTKYMQLIPVVNEAWGIRLRKGNIQVGDEFTLQRFFRENRFHRYFIGEIHVLHEELFPNGQRDYFDECELLSEFEDALHGLTSKLQNICRKASEWNSAEKKVETYADQIEKFEDTLETQEFYSPEHEKEEKDKLDKIRENAEKAKKQLKRIEQHAEDNETLARFVQYRSSNNTEKKNTESPKKNKGNSSEKKSNGKKYKANKLSKLSRKEQKLVGEIYEVIRTILSPDLQNVLIYKIEERFGITKSHE